MKEEPKGTSTGLEELAEDEQTLQSHDIKVRTFARRKLLLKKAKPIREEIQKKYGHILDIAPATVLIPVSPLASNENELLDCLRDAINWATLQEGVRTANVYKLVEGDPKKKPPQFILILGTEDRNVVERMGDSEEGRQIQRKLMEASVGDSAHEERTFVINHMLMGLK